MKRLLHPISITFYVVSLIIALPFLLPNKKEIKLSDNAFRQAALSRNMFPVPQTYEALLKVLDTKDNLMK